MDEYIGCRNCNSPNCKGCNIKTLETMLNNGKFDCLMDENHCINPTADVAPVRHGQWISFLDGDHIMPERYYRCSRCGRVESSRQPYCHCGAKMDGGSD